MNAPSISKITWVLWGALAAFAIVGLSTSTSLAADSAHAGASTVEFPRDAQSYDDADLGIVVAQGVSERNCFAYSDFVGHDAGANMPYFAPGAIGARD